MAEAQRETATFAGGCFWCLQPIFQDLKGVDRVVVGYTGGHVKDPTYDEVCTDATGHAEAVQVTFDPGAIPYEDLLRVFFAVHNPTTLNRQGADVGTQYRSAIFFDTPEQKAAAERIRDEVEKARVWDDPIVTELTPLSTFYPAEGYHQDYFAKNPGSGYCRAVVAPKVAKFRKENRERLKA
ncbi:MAG TPA: peptide-methionine (S)-S-oxide reductase MsrA [Thermoplasmata archaeon]